MDLNVQTDEENSENPVSAAAFTACTETCGPTCSSLTIGGCSGAGEG